MSSSITKNILLLTGPVALFLALNSCTLNIINGADGHTLSLGTPKLDGSKIPDKINSNSVVVSNNLMNDIRNSKSGLYAIVNGTTLIRCNEYYQPHNLPEDPPIPIIPPDKDNDLKFIMNSLTTNISQKTTTINVLRTKLQNEYRDVLQACLDSQ